MQADNVCLKIINAVADKLLGDKANDLSPQVGVSRTGSLVIDRESLHSSKVYERQIAALRSLEEKLAVEQTEQREQTLDTDQRAVGAQR